MKFLFWIAVASGPLALGLWFLAGFSPALVESVYSRAVYPGIMGPWSRLVGLVPFAVVPWLALGLVLGAVGLFWVVPPGRALALVAAGASVVLAWFVLGWGLNYQRESWATNHGLTTSGGTVAALEALADRLADRAGPLRVAAWSAGTPDFTSVGVRQGITRAYLRWSRSEPLVGGRFGDPKPFPAPELLSWLGISGIFIPFTAEPLVNLGPGDWQLPFTAAHEAAHLRGWAREDEANFLAFEVLKDDPDPKLAYSAWSSALLYVAQALSSAGPPGQEAWGRVLSRVSEGVKEDWKVSFAYWDRFKGPVREASQTVNDLYLKSQGQADGVRSYGRMVDLLLATEGASGTAP
jgi:hypothetical protein